MCDFAFASARVVTVSRVMLKALLWRIRSYTNLKTFKLNFGPQHPAAHGVLRLILELNGEIVVRADPHIGFLHRGTEKLLEFKSFLQGLPYFDRLDYVSMMTQEHAFVLSVEALQRDVVPFRASLLRVLFSEITRLLNHIMALTTHAMDVGALTPFLWGFEEREKLMGFYEQISGARMHAAYFRPGGVSFDAKASLMDEIYFFCFQFSARIDEMEELLTNNRIWRRRLIGVGAISSNEGPTRGITGVLLRSVGVVWDLRKVQTYEFYSGANFTSALAITGDCFDRYLIRVWEMRQSTLVSAQCVLALSSGALRSLVSKGVSLFRSFFKASMETLIGHFELYSNTQLLSSGEAYCGIEAPKGEFGTYLATNGGALSYRCKIRSPGLIHLQSLDYMIYNHFLADTTTLIGTQDIVFGEVDR